MRAVRIILLIVFVTTFVNSKGQNVGGKYADHQKKNTTTVIDSVALKGTGKKMHKKIIIYIDDKTIKKAIFLQFKGPRIKIFGQEFLISEMNANYENNYFFQGRYGRYGS